MRKMIAVFTAICVLAVSAAAIDASAEEGKTFLNNNTEAGIRDLDEAEESEDNLLSNLTVADFYPRSSGVFWSEMGTGVTEIGTILTDGIRDISYGSNKWYVQNPDTENTSYVTYEFDGEKTINTIAIYAGRKDGGKATECVITENIEIFGYHNALGKWQKLIITDMQNSVDDTVSVPSQTILVCFNRYSFDKIKICFGTNGTGTYNSSRGSEFRIMEIEAYNRVREDSVDGGVYGEEEPPPGSDYGDFDYDTSKNILFGLPEEDISISSGECARKQALCDGQAESATGYGDTKWFVISPSQEEYVEFRLEEEKTVDKLIVCSGPDMAGDPDIVENLQLLYWAGDKFVPANGSEIWNNSSETCEVSFPPVISSRFRLLVKNTIRFRIREVRLEGPEITLENQTPEENSRIDNGTVNISFFLKADADDCSRVTVQVDDTEREATGTDGFYMSTAELSGSASHTAFIRVYNNKNEITFRKIFAFITLNMSKGMRSFNDLRGSAAQVDALKNMIPDFKLLVLETEVFENIGKGTGEEFVQQFSHMQDYPESEEGIIALYHDACEVLPMAAVNGAENEEEMISALNTFGRKLNINTEDFLSFSSDEKKQVCTNLLTFRRENGAFQSAEKFRQEFLNSSALTAYHNTYALLLPDLFEKYQDVCVITVEDIPAGMLNSVLFALKKSVVNHYTDIPDALKRAYVAVESGQKNSSSSGRGGGSSSLGRSTSGGMILNASDQTENESKGETVVSIPEGFSDLSGYEWASESILKLYRQGIVAGDGGGRFRCTNNVTRAEFVKMLVLALDLPVKSADCDFEDVTAGSWYYEPIAAAYSLGIVKGKDERCFMPEAGITREETAVIIYRALMVCDYGFSNIGEESVYTDQNRISDFAVDAVNMLSLNGLMQGSGGAFHPAEKLTRAEAAVAVARLIQ